jgi:Patatin-like phospholipase
MSFSRSGTEGNCAQDFDVRPPINLDIDLRVLCYRQPEPPEWIAPVPVVNQYTGFLFLTLNCLTASDPRTPPWIYPIMTSSSTSTASSSRRPIFTSSPTSATSSSRIPTNIASSPNGSTTDGLRILCFDGGGVRGKASLLMLKEIMRHIKPGAKPCDFFDLIAGTSTGGLIAIMLARLRYDLDEAIEKYDSIGPRIFSSVESTRRWILRGEPVVDEGPAEIAFREIGSVDGRDEDMSDRSYSPCKVRFHFPFPAIRLFIIHPVLCDDHVAK